MNLRDAFIYRVVGPLNPSWKAQLLWSQKSGDAAGKVVVDRVLRAGDIAIDVGANFGFYTDRFARLVGPTGHVYAFEPHPSYQGMLRRIAKARRNVSVISSALSSQSSMSVLSAPVSSQGPNAAMASLEPRTMGSHDVIQVATTTLDEKLGDLRRVRFLKCDVEGHEHDVLLGGTRLLERDHPVLFIEIEQRHRERLISETFQLLQDLGYDGYMMRQSHAQPLKDFDVDRDQLDLIADDMSTPTPPRDYVNDFLFVPIGSRVPA